MSNSELRQKTQNSFSIDSMNDIRRQFAKEQNLGKDHESKSSISSTNMQNSEGKNNRSVSA